MDHKTIDKALELLFLVITFSLTVLDFFELLPADVVLVTKIMSMAALGYVFYRLSFMKLFFGKRQQSRLSHRSHLKNVFLDILILFSFYCLMINDFFSFLATIGSESVFFRRGIELVVQNRAILGRALFNLGSLLLLCLSLYLGGYLRFEKPSLISLIHEEEYPKTMADRLKRAATVFLLLIVFFIVYFSLISEWFAIAVDTPIALFGFFFGIFIIRNKHYTIFRDLEAVEEYGEKVSSFFEEGLSEMFHSKRKIFYVLSGMLVLHLVTDLFSFVLPFIMGNEGFYVPLLGGEGNIPSLLTLFARDTNGVAGILTVGSVAWLYLCMITTIILLVLLPALLWWESLQRKKVHAKRLLLSIYVGCLFLFLTKSAFRIEPIRGGGFIGVKFVFGTALGDKAGLVFFVIASIALMALTYFLSAHHRTKRAVEIAGLLVPMIFLTQYILYYLLSTYDFYTQFIGQSIAHGDLMIGGMSALFFVASVIFYPVSYLLLLKQARDEIARVD